MKLPLSLLLAFFSSAEVFAQKNYFAFMGGGGDPAGDTTIFDSEISRVGRFAQSSHWNSQVSFNGGHRTTENILHNSFSQNGSRNTPFTQESFERIIANYERKINSGDIKAGDQLLLYISTHGAINNSKEKTHSISTTGAAARDLNTLEGSKQVSLDRLGRLINLANTKGVKLAILDFSCHSGNTLALKNPNTCIISGSGSNHFSYNIWGEQFSTAMAPGKNLEQVFLQTLYLQTTTPAFPMISTPVGNDFSASFYRLITPYLYQENADEGKGKLENFLNNNVRENQCSLLDKNFSDLMNLSDNLQRTIGTLNRGDSLFDPFKKAVRAYYEVLSSLQKNLQFEHRQSELLEKSEKFCVDNHRQKRCRIIKHRSMLAINYDQELSRVQNRKLVQGYDENQIRLELDFLNQQKMKKQELLSSNPDYQEYVRLIQSYSSLMQTTSAKAREVNAAFIRIYDRYYRELSQKDQRPNPCKDFVL
jgi:hypothetical protein